MLILIALILIIVIGFYILTKDKNKLNKDIINKIKDEDIDGNKEKINIIHISDIHYLSMKLTDYKGSFFEKVEKNDGKTVRYIDKIMDAFILEMIKVNPDLIIVSGDLTYKGEKESHDEFAKKLKILKDKNISVVVLPGNHDIDSNSAKRYIGDEEESVESVTIEDFKNIYSDFGYGESSRIIGRDKDSLSYMYRLNSYINILMLDTSTDNNKGYISNSTYKWIEKMLKSAKSNNETTISVTHQNILAHNKIFLSGYVIKNGTKMVDLMNKYNVRLNLSGHMHLQHISESKGVYDVAVGTIAMYPNLYGDITVDMRKNITYEAKSLAVGYWMRKYGTEDENLINFEEYSKNSFMKVSKNQSEFILQNEEISDNELEKMVNFLADTSLSYFSGEMNIHPELSTESDGYKLWQKYYEKHFIATYLNSIYLETPKDQKNLKIEL
ncbi:metallophosphoesterase [Peptostreptococcus faecalis]|uniref:metallophosphoesterase n=1 Tax=Peptostreptococcus faecalis TaxID=2045015 RepID=UPI000C7961F1|nr:metallophosphoesterase [Peptostreptococcus faecalis]